MGDTLSTLRVRDLRHIHTRAVRRIAVTVNFNGKHRKRKFSPAATVARVLAWAKKRFKIDPAAGADYVLQLLPEKTIPRPEEHLGDLRLGAKELEFDLVREVTPPGAFGTVFGFVTTGFSVAGTVFPLVYGALMDHGNPRAIFILSAACCLLSVATVLVIRKRPVAA